MKKGIILFCAVGNQITLQDGNLFTVAVAEYEPKFTGSYPCDFEFRDNSLVIYLGPGSENIILVDGNYTRF